jgi:surface polysaccharide O-acyltransferase-like enzyme
MEKKRDYIYDFLRVLACIFIIFIHCAERFLHGNKYDLVFYEYTFTSALVRSGVSLFFIISGALLLNKKDESLGQFYLKRFSKVVVPLFLYSLIFIFMDDYNYSIDFFKPLNFFNAFLKIFSEPAYYHLWFIYTIIGIYLFVPFLRKMLQNLNDKECAYLFVLLIIVCFIKYFLPSCGININIDNLLIIDRLIPFVFGYLLTRDVINKHYKIIYVLGVLSFVFYIIALAFLPNFEYLNTVSPTMQFETMAIFLFFIRNKNRICGNASLNKAICFISVYTYEIYIIHAKVLDLLQMNLYYNVTIVSPYITMLIVAFLTFIISFAVALIINNLITKNIIRLINLIFKLKVRKV